MTFREREGEEEGETEIEIESTLPALAMNQQISGAAGDSGIRARL